MISLNIEGGRKRSFSGRSGAPFSEKVLVLALCTTIALAVFYSSPLVSEVCSAAPLISVTPSFQTVLGSGEIFSVNISTFGVTNLYAYEINLYYDSGLLNGTSITEGPFLKSQGLTFFIKNFNDNYNVTHGFARVADSVLGDVPGVSGSGVLATITFQTKQLGSGYLELGGTKLADPTNTPITHTASGGRVQVVPIVRDVAVRSVNASATEAFAGQVLNVYAVVANEGNKTETFNVTAFANDAAVATATVSNLTAGGSTTVTLPWNTADVAPGDYTIRAEAEALPDETHLSDNVFLDGSVRIVPGIHDVAVSSVSVSSSELYEGQTAQILVAVINNGNLTETFGLSAYYGETIISTQMVSALVPREQRTVSFVWNTTGFPLGVSDPIKAVADAVGGEVNLADNTFVDGEVTILPRPVPSLTIMEVIPSNQIGEPASGFKTGTMAYFKVTINATSVGPEPVLVTLNMFDSENTAIGVVSFRGPVVPGISSFVLGLPVPQISHAGASSVYVNIFTDWPHLGGTQYCPEKSSSFEIIGG